MLHYYPTNEKKQLLSHLKKKQVAYIMGHSLITSRLREGEGEGVRSMGHFVTGRERGLVDA